MRVSYPAQALIEFTAAARQTSIQCKNETRKLNNTEGRFTAISTEIQATCLLHNTVGVGGWRGGVGWGVQAMEHFAGQQTIESRLT